MIECAGIGVTAHAEVCARPAFILVTDIALADIARHDADFHWWVEFLGAAPSHDYSDPAP
jgi:hypothetical protein